MDGWWALVQLCSKSDKIGAYLDLPNDIHQSHSVVCAMETIHSCYNPPYIFPGSRSPDPMTIRLLDKPPVLKDQPHIIFPSAMPPDLMSKWPLPMNSPLVEDLPPHADTPRPISTEPLPEPLVLEPPVEPLVPIPWNIHHCQYLSMEEFVKHVMQNLVSWPMDDLDSPMSDAPLLEPDPVMPYLPDSPEGHTHTLSPDESPTEPWQWWLDHPDSPVSRKHSLSPSSPSSAPIRQCTSWEGSYHSITPQTSLPAASTEALNEGNQLVLTLESLDSTPATQTPTPVDNNELSLNWVTLAHTYWKGLCYNKTPIYPKQARSNHITADLPHTSDLGSDHYSASFWLGHSTHCLPN